jgi:adenylate kinase
LDIPLDVALERLTQRSLDPVTGHRFHTHDQPVPSQHIKQRLACHPTDEDEAVQRRYQTYSVYFDDLQDYYSQHDAIHIPADQDAYTVFEAVEAGIVNPLNKDDN